MTCRETHERELEGPGEMKGLTLQM